LQTSAFRARLTRSAVARAHAFCPRHRDAGRAEDPDDPFLLRLRPAALSLEAGVSPGFTEIDERVQARLIAELMDDLADDPARQDTPSTPWSRISATRTA
jgi:hypothetical protein